jgi:hypothetical protein
LVIALRGSAKQQRKTEEAPKGACLVPACSVCGQLTPGRNGNRVSRAKPSSGLEPETLMCPFCVRAGRRRMRQRPRPATVTVAASHRRLQASGCESPTQLVELRFLGMHVGRCSRCGSRAEGVGGVSRLHPPDEPKSGPGAFEQTEHAPRSHRVTFGAWPDPCPNCLRTQSSPLPAT